MRLSPTQPTLLLFLLSAAGLAAVPKLPETVEFNRDIRPILSDNCFQCHGPDKAHRKAELRLDVREDALEKEAFVPGKPDQSELVKRLHSKDSDEVMPPPDSNKKLTSHQKALLEQWVKQGGQYQLHWSYEKPVKAPVPAGKNPVDTLVSKRLDSLGLKFSPEADRRTLIRRLYSDLLGLPPSPVEVSAFEADTQPDAYQKLVSKLLENPHYGERMALGWLDVVRFADTIGYHSDTPRNVWPYRDWVIKAFNDNKRFDRFTLEQVAGDLLPDANRETRVGSAFNRLILSTEEGGAQAKDYEARMLTDRVRAIGAAWLGQTTGCAQCHDHKFDPITTKDFYSLGAFFADIKEPVIGRREDGMLVVSDAEQAEMSRLDGVLAAAKKQFDAIAPQLEAAQKAWETEQIAAAGASLTLPELAKDAKTSEADKKAAQLAAAALKKEAKTRNAKEKLDLQTYFRTRVTTLFREETAALAAAEKARKEYYDPLAKCLVTESSAQARTVRILARGNFLDDSGEVVKAALPHYLPQPKIEGRALTRLDLAQWLVSGENPLTARTVMNRLWKQFFGTGLSKVLDDLGAQGEPPPNGALLDWLACEFMDSGWDVKHMVLTLVNSATYKQVSVSNAALTAADPYNREHARQSTFRYDAELVRDNALAVSGLLAPKIGGPSAKPYQPERYWENLNFPTREWANDQGEGLYRRGLYTWWQRSFLHPALLAFDAPSREECCAERTRSNIPQQALVLLNDPTYVEAARAFAARILKEGSGSSEERLQWAFQQVLQRNPRREEVKTLLAVLEKNRSVYEADKPAAEAVLKSGQAPVPAQLDKVELAAWLHVARVLLNLHESITRA
jgi:mono/diheme cytochrome c family protein